MKRFFFLSIMLLLLCKAWTQQTVNRSSLEPQVGFVVSSMSDAALDCRHGVGLCVGLEYSHSISNYANFCLDILYAREYTKPRAYTDYKQENGEMQFYIIDNNLITHDRLNIPLMLGFKTIHGLKLLAGLQVSMLLSAKKKSHLTGNYYYEQITRVQKPVDCYKHESIKGDLHGLTFDVPVGMSYEWGQFVLDTRYHFGLGHFVKGKKGSHHYFQFNVGYRITLY